VCHPEFLDDLQHWIETDRRTAGRLVELRKSGRVSTGSLPRLITKWLPSSPHELPVRLIASQWPELHGEAQKVEQFALSDPRTACFYARRTIELLVEWVYDNDSRLERPFGYVG
jgi:hypothetical protein